MVDLGRVTKVLDSQSKDYAFVYTSYSSSTDGEEEHLESQKRRLLEAEAWTIDYEACDNLCLVSATCALTSHECGRLLPMAVSVARAEPDGRSFKSHTVPEIFLMHLLDARPRILQSNMYFTQFQVMR